eukprot:6205072-Prymnesium_polylepis.1
MSGDPRRCTAVVVCPLRHAVAASVVRAHSARMLSRRFSSSSVATCCSSLRSLSCRSVMTAEVRSRPVMLLLNDARPESMASEDGKRGERSGRVL